MKSEASLWTVRYEDSDGCEPMSVGRFATRQEAVDWMWKFGNERCNGCEATKHDESPGSAEKQTTKVGVTAVIRDDAGRILLGLKGRAFSDDFKGKWVTPGGRVNFNETLEAATIREAMEETGVEIKIIRSLPPQEIIHKDGHFVFFAYEAQWVCGAPSAGDDLLEVKWCNEEMIGQISLTPLTKTVIESAQPSTLETRNRQLVQAMGEAVKVIENLHTVTKFRPHPKEYWDDEMELEQARKYQAAMDASLNVNGTLALLKEMGKE